MQLGAIMAVVIEEDYAGNGIGPSKNLVSSWPGYVSDVMHVQGLGRLLRADTLPRLLFNLAKPKLELSQRRSLNSLSTHPPPLLLRHLQASYEADFRYAA